MCVLCVCVRVSVFVFFGVNGASCPPVMGFGAWGLARASSQGCGGSMRIAKQGARRDEVMPH